MSETEEGVRREFEDLVPWYVNGTLDEAGRRRFEELRREIPGAEDVIDEDVALQRLMRTMEGDAPADIGLAEVQRRIQASHAGGAVARVAAGARANGAAGARSSWLGTLGRWFGGFATGPVGAFAAILVLIQGVTIGMLVHRGDAVPARAGYADTRSPDPAASGPGRFFKIGFAPDARESDIRFLLVEIGARIVDGPSQLGDYTVALPPGGSADAVARLKGNAIVLSVTQTAPRVDGE
jgi:hypothetical protein